MKRLQQTIVKMWMNRTPQIIPQVRLSGVHCETVVRYVYNKFHQHKFHFCQIYCDVSSNSNMFNGIKQCDCVLFSSDEHDDDQIPKMSRNNRFINSESKKCVILLTAQWKNEQMSVLNDLIRYLHLLSVHSDESCSLNAKLVFVLQVKILHQQSLCTLWAVMKILARNWRTERPKQHSW